MIEQVAGLGVAAALGAPLPVLGVERGGGHDQMDVGVIVERPGVGMQHRDGAGDAAKLAIVVR